VSYSAFKRGGHPTDQPTGWPLGRIGVAGSEAAVLNPNTHQAHPWESRRSVRIAPAIAVIVAFSAVHITGMMGLRKSVLWMLGGAYDFRFSPATQPRLDMKRARATLSAHGGARARKIPKILQPVKYASRSRFGPGQCTKPLLFAPRLMLERRPQVHRAVRASPNGADHPFHEPLCPLRADEVRTARLIAKG
jgi:hypothetical protein